VTDVRIGLIGCGGMGKSLANALRDVERGELVAVCDTVEDVVRSYAEETGARPYISHEDLLADKDVDAVIVAAPNYLHAPITIAAAKAGKHVFCEKPMALNVGDCRSMIQACKDAGVKLMIGQVLRYLQPFDAMLNLVREGNIGKPFSATITRISGGWGSPQAWRAKQEYCGGVLFEVSQHEFDFMRCVCGEVKSVYAAMGRFVQEDIDYPDFNYVMLNFMDGGHGLLLAGMSSAIGSYDGKILGSEGSIFFGRSDGKCVWKRFDGEEQTLETSETEPGVRREIREWVECIVDDLEPTIPGEQGLRNVEIAQAAVVSAQRGEPVQLPL